MPKRKQRDLALFIVDVFVAIEKIASYVSGFQDAESFRHSSLHWDASIRQLELIGEALNNLLEDEDFSLQAPAYFRKVVNFRNEITHGYFGIDADEVWDVVCNKLMQLRAPLKTLVRLSGREKFTIKALL